MNSRLAPLRALWVIMAACGLLVAGCAGHASVHTAALSTRKIGTTGSLVRTVTPDECYFWVNQKQELRIAMRGTRLSLLGSRFKREYVLSLILEGLPAGSTRNYRMNLRTLRARHRRGYGHVRSASVTGIAAIWDYGRRRLHGRFRVVAKEQSYSVLSGWGSNRRVLILGEFTAVENQRAAEAILAQTEKDGMQRRAARPRPKPVKAR